MLAVGGKNCVQGSRWSSAAELSQQEENANPELFRLSKRVRRFLQGGHEAFASDSAEYKEALSSVVNSHRRGHINKLRAAAAVDRRWPRRKARPLLSLTSK